MALEPLGTLAVAVYLGAVVLSLPAAGAVLLSARRLGLALAAALVGAAVVLFVAAAAVALGVTTGLRPSLAFAASGAAAVAILWVVPVVLGRWLVRRFAGTGGDLAVGYAVAGLPVATTGSAVWLVALGGPFRSDLAFPSGPSPWAAAAVFLAIVLLGPGLVGVGLYRIAGRRR